MSHILSFWLYILPAGFCTFWLWINSYISHKYNTVTTDIYVVSMKGNIKKIFLSIFVSLICHIYWKFLNFGHLISPVPVCDAMLSSLWCRIPVMLCGSFCHVTRWLLKTSLLTPPVLGIVHFCILYLQSKTLNRFANFFPQSTDMQTVMHFQLTHLIS